jgi:micrococcal nuclease
MGTKAETKGLVIWVVAVCLLLGLGAAVASTPLVAGQVLNLKGVKTVDGDTLMVRHEGQELSVDLAGIDAPELDQPWGDEARDLVRSMVRGEVVEVTVVTAGEQQTTARVVARGQDLSTVLARAGLARPAAAGGGDQAVVALCDRAQLDHTGMWRDIAASD